MDANVVGKLVKMMVVPSAVKSVYSMAETMVGVLELTLIGKMDGMLVASLVCEWGV